MSVNCHDESEKIDSMFIQSKRVNETDKWVRENVSDRNLSNHLFVRLVAKGRRFKNVKFQYSIFDNCYLRKCVFDSCDFTGARFTASSLYESSFVGCKFDYCTFERTVVGSEILDVGCPGYENLKLRFARTLRMNYQQLGDAKSSNKAIEVELRATEIHLFKAWRSNESYYRQKYTGLDRLKVFIEWVDFKVLDFVWGNGESTFKLLRAVAIVLACMAVIDVMAWGEVGKVSDYVISLGKSPQIFLGILSPDAYPRSYLTAIAFVRLISIGFFMSIIIKRFNRR